MTPTITDGTVVSADGTRIAVSSVGDGAPLVLVAGPFGTRSAGQLAARAAALSDRFRVTYYDRRGRGGSGTVAATSVQQEVDDLAAVIAAASDGPVSALGVCTGSGLVLEGMAAGLPIARAVAYEPPYRAAVTIDRLSTPERLAGLVAGGRRRAAVSRYLSDYVGSPRFLPLALRLPPRVLRVVLAAAATVPNEARIARGAEIPTAMLARIDAPTLVVHGGRSPDWVKLGSRAAVAAIPGARHTVLQSSGRVPDEAALAEVAGAFLVAEPDPQQR